MSDLENALKRVLMPVNREGYFVIAISCVITFLLFIIDHLFGGIGFVLTMLIVYFFRDPIRVSPDDSNVVLAPADGIVDKIEETSIPKELGINSDIKYQRVSIFLSMFNVHIQRIPISGTIKKLEYIQGKFLNITNDKYHDDNERQLCLMETNRGLSIAFVQIAGMIARRIVCNLKENQIVNAGEKFGCIKFGSRVDIYLPDNISLKVKVGQTMIAGETVIGAVNDK